MKRPRITYYYRGRVERVRRGGRYNWYTGYSANSPEGNPLYPWMTKPECREDAHRQDSVAVFKEKS